MSRRRAYLWAAAPAVLVVIASGLVTGLSDVRTSQLVSEPAGTHGFPVYHGIFSHFGVALWIAAATIALFATVVLRRADPEPARFFRAAGLLTIVLAADDLLLFHEQALPRLTGVPEAAVFALYGLGAVAILARHRRFAFADGRGLLALAGGAFAAAVGADLWDPSGLDVLVEDALKILGIGAWLTFLAVRAAGRLAPRGPAVPTGGPARPA